MIPVHKREPDEAQYVFQGGVLCPFCNSYDIEGGDNPEFALGVATCDCHCHECGAEWTDNFVLTTMTVTKRPEGLME